MCLLAFTSSVYAAVYHKRVPARPGGACPVMAVRPEGANHQWRKIPPGELSIDPVANERLGWVTGRAGAS
jgi:hypothetical protein